MPIPKLENEPRLMGLGLPAALVEWARRVGRAVNPLIDAVGDPRAGALPISAALDGPAFRAYHSVDITSAIQGSLRAIALDTEAFDTNNAYDPATGKFQPTVAGYYSLSGSVLFNSITSTMGNVQGRIWKNGVATIYLSLFVPNGAGSNSHFGVSGTDLVFLNGTTDYAQLAYYGTTATGTLTILGGVESSSFKGFLARRA